MSANFETLGGHDSVFEDMLESTQVPNVLNYDVDEAVVGQVAVFEAEYHIFAESLPLTQY